MAQDVKRIYISVNLYQGDEMNFVRAFFLIIMLIVAFRASAQKRVTINGYVKDKESGESLSGALVSVVEAGAKVLSNDYGFFSLTVPAGDYKLRFYYLGYEGKEERVQLRSDTVLNVALTISANLMDEVMVSSAQANGNISKPVHASPLSISSVRLLPSFLGEADLIRSFQLLPGVSSVGDGASGFNVRGGGIDQNLVMQDEAPLYFTSHLFNLFSVANPDAVKDASLYKTEMPARFGGRLSSVLDTRLKDGNNKEWGVTGGLGLIASRITVEGPVTKNKSSLIVSARRSYTDLITRQSSDPDIRNNSIYFYDLSAKFNLSISARDKLFVSAYFGRDKIKANTIFRLNWGNGTGALRWNHVFNPKLFLNTSIIYSDYKYSLGSENSPSNSFVWNAGINDYILKSGFSWYPDTENTIFMGVEGTFHQFIPGKAEPVGDESIFRLVEMPGQRSAALNFYGDHEIKFSEVFAGEYGLRYSIFQSIADGETTVYDYRGVTGERKEPVGPRIFKNWDNIKTYHYLQPRLSLKLQAGRYASLKISYNRTAQDLHLISNTMSVSPLDMWVPSSYNIKPETADQFSAGYFRGFIDNKYQGSVEVYYRKLHNQIDFIDGAETVMNENQVADMLFGKGRAYGAEFYAKKHFGKLNGWLSYTLSRTERKFDGINNSQYFPAKFDKTHSLSLVAVYQLNPFVVFSGTYSYASGTPVTLPADRFEVQGYPVQFNSGNYRNNYRIPSYKRVDLSATFRPKALPGKRYHSEWVVSLFNVLNRRNAFSVYLRQNSQQPSDFEAVRFAMFGTVIPSVTWNFKF